MSRQSPDPTVLLLVVGVVFCLGLLSLLWTIDAYRDCTASGLSWSTCLRMVIK